jgi:hypothetical protein
VFLNSENRYERLAVVAVIAVLIGMFAASPAWSFNLARILGRGEQGPDTFKLIHVADLKGLMANHKVRVHVFDANAPDVRNKYGVIPGARLLSSDDNYNLNELPPNKDAELVFYCTNSH